MSRQALLIGGETIYPAAVEFLIQERVFALVFAVLHTVAELGNSVIRLSQPCDAENLVVARSRTN